MWIKLDADPYELNSRQRQDLISWDQTVGRPSDFAVWEQKIWISPQPDAVYTLTHSYMKTEPALSGDSDAVLCPDHFADIIVVYACLIEARRMHDGGLEDALLTDKKEWLRNVAKLVPQSDLLPRIKVGRNWPRGH